MIQNMKIFANRLIQQVVKNIRILIMAAFLTGSAEVRGLPGSYVNPVIPNGADPFCYRASNGTYYLITTGLNFFSSADLINWKNRGKLKLNNTWGKYDFWAPEFVEYQGRYYLFYCARKTEAGPHFLGVAVSDSPEGPFRSQAEPLTDISPSIDPDVLIDDDGRKYLYWSEKGIGVDHRAINGCELTDDLMSLKGRPRMLIYSTQKWEFGKNWQDKGWNEGPCMLKRHGTYYLLFSANLFASPYYGVGFATSDNPLGRYSGFKKWNDNPILSREGYEDIISGPGHNSVVVSPDGRELFIVYHKHVQPGNEDRQVCIDRMGFREDGSIYVNGPTVTPQPLPSGVNGLINVAPEARIHVTSGRQESARFLNDGEISIHSRFSDREWVADRDRSTLPVVRLEWETPPEVSELFLYDSGRSDQQVKRASVLLSDGTEFKDVEFPGGPGAAAFLTFSARTVKWITIQIDESLSAGPPALSEVMVWGRP